MKCLQCMLLYGIMGHSIENLHKKKFSYKILYKILFLEAKYWSRIFLFRLNVKIFCVNQEKYFYIKITCPPILYDFSQLSNEV